MKTKITIVLWVLLAIAVAATQGSRQSSGSDATPTAGSGLSRTVLVGATPAAAPDQSLQLARIEIAPGTKLPAHVHPGTQLASIASGELTYTVLSGEIRVERAASNGTPGPVEVLKTGDTTVLHPGDSVIETEGMLHYGENLGTETVVILAASLFTAGEPASITEEATPVS